MTRYPTLEKILGKQIISMSRGRVVVDENLAGIVPLLQDRNIRVTTPDKGKTDSDIMRDLIGNRIFITNNAKNFLDSAIETETWIISTEKVRKKLLDKDLAELISKTIQDLKLFSKRITGGMLITLNLTGKPLIKILED